MSSYETSLLPPPPAPPAPQVPVVPNSSMNGLNPNVIAGSPMIKNALAEYMRKNKAQPRPFNSILSKPKAGPTPPPGPPVAPQTAPAPDPDAQSQAALNSAYAAENAFKPYVAPARPKPDPVTGIIDLIAAALTRKSGANIGAVEGNRIKQQQEQYDQDVQEKSAESDRQQAMLDKRVDVAERGVYNQQQIDVKNQANAIRQKQIEGAQRIAQQRANAYTRQVAGQIANDKAKLAQQAKLAADANGIKQLGIAQRAVEAQWRDYTAMSNAQMHDDTARTLAGQRLNMQLLIEKLREKTQFTLQSQRADVQRQIASLHGTISYYNNLISKGSSPLASAQAQAEAQALLTPDKNGQTPYDKAIQAAQAVGVTVNPTQANTDFDDLGVQSDALQKQYLDDYLSDIDAGTSNPYAAGGQVGGGGNTYITNLGPGGNGPTLAQVDAGGPYGTGGGQPPGGGGVGGVDEDVSHLTGVVGMTAQQAGQQWGVAPGILMRMIGAESSGREIDPATGRIITSKSGAEGIAQFKPETAKQYGVNVNDVNSSVMGMAHYMSDLMKKFGGSPIWATAAYNAGPDGAMPAYRLKDPTKLPAETQAYLKAVYGDDVMSYMGSGPQGVANKQPTPSTVAGKPGDATKQAAVVGKTDPNADHAVVPPQQWAENVIKKYSADPNYQGKSFEQVWPSMKDAMLNLKPPLSGPEIQQIGALVKPRIDKAYAASVKAQQDQQGKNIASTRYQDLINSGASPEQAQATIAREAGGISAEAHQQPQAQAPQQKPTMSAPAFVKQKIAEYTRLTGSLPPGAMQQIAQSLMQTYKMTPQQAQSVIKIAMKPQPQQTPMTVAGAR